MILIKNLRIWILLLGFLLLFSNSVFSTNIEVSINETSSLRELLSGSYSLQSNGILEIHNPSNISKVYELTIPVELDSLIGLTKISIDNSSQFFSFSFDSIKGYLLEPNQTVRVGYSFYGLLNYNLYNQLHNESVFEYYTQDIQMLSTTGLNVQKFEREGLRYNDSGVLINDTAGNVSQRLVRAGIRNPTDFSYTAKEIRIYRNVVENNQSYYDSGNLITRFNNISINPYGYVELDYLDPFSVNNSIYWLSTDILIDYDLNKSFTTSFSKQRGSGGGSGGSSSDLDDVDDVINESLLQESLLIKKSTDKTVIGQNGSVKVFLTIVNAEEFAVEDLVITDTTPQDYELVSVLDDVKVSRGELNFKIDNLEGLSSRTLEYTLKNNKKINGVTYLQPAEMVYGENSYFSDGVLLINNLLPDKRVFVQKEVSYVDDEFAKVTLRVKNLGSVILEDLLVRDQIGDDFLIKDISELFFEKGTWKIKELGPGGEWEVTYLIERNDQLKTLPNVFGVEQENIFGTMISSGEVVTVYNESSRAIERWGLILSIGLLVVYLLF